MGLLFALYQNDGYEDQSVQTSPEERKRVAVIGNDYLEKLKRADFDCMSIYGKMDYEKLTKFLKLRKF